MEKINIVIVDDHELYRLGEKAVITEKLPQVTILAEYGSGQELLVHLENGVCPDIILLDIVMPGISGIETAEIVREKYPHIKIIMLSSEVAPEVINTLIDIGVNGYLSKLAVKEDLAKAILAVYDNNLYYGQDISRIIYDMYIAQSVNKPKQKSKLFSTKNKTKLLTDKEESVVKLLCEGLPTKIIADKLSISKRTVETHKYNSMQKLGFHSTIELVKYAIREGIIVL